MESGNEIADRIVDTDHEAIAFDEKFFKLILLATIMKFLLTKVTDSLKKIDEEFCQ